MNARDITATLGGLVGVGAAAAAVLTIRLLLTAPTTVAGVIEGGDDPLRAIARALLEALAHLVRYL